MQATREIVVLEDPGSVRDHGVRLLLRQEGHEVVVIKSLYELLEYVSEVAPFALVVARDYRTGGGGWVVAEQVWERQPALPVLLVAHDDLDEEHAPAGRKSRVLSWPFSGEVLRAAFGAVSDNSGTLGVCA